MSRSDGGDEAEALRERAAQVRRIARQINDDTARERLLELADEYDNRAEAFEGS